MPATQGGTGFIDPHVTVWKKRAVRESELHQSFISVIWLQRHSWGSLGSVWHYPRHPWFFGVYPLVCGVYMWGVGHEG